MNRIVLVLSAFPQLSESFIVNKFTGLIDKGWDVHIICHQFKKNELKHFPQLLDRPGWKTRVHRTWPVRPKWLSVLLLPFALATCLAAAPGRCLRYLAKAWRNHNWNAFKRLYLDLPIILLKPDLIHFEFGATAVGRADLGYLLGCKEIVSFRGYDLNFSGLDQPEYYADVWQYADGYHFLGHDLRERGLRRGCPQEKPFTLIPPAIDTGYFAPSSEKTHKVISSERPLRILSVGRLEWKKGYEYGFQAVRMLEDKGIQCEYHIVGSGAYLEPLAFTRHKLELDSVVSFLGAQPRQRVKEELEWADVFLHSAVSEGFCNAVLEAQSMQVPVVCSDAGGLPENVEDGVTGYVVPRRDPGALAEKLAVLAKSPALRAQFGKAGRQRVIREFQLDDQIRKFEEFYQKVLK